MLRLLQRLFFYACWPGLYIYFQIGDRSRVLVGCNGEVVLVKGWWNRLFADDRWALPGGGRKHSETPAQGACRELHEELGLTVKPNDLQFIGRQRVSDNGISYKADFFRLDYTVKPALVARAETTAIAWAGLDDSHHVKQDVIIGRRRNLL